MECNNESRREYQEDIDDHSGPVLPVTSDRYYRWHCARHISTHIHPIDR
jgi:hypothetical protein